MLKKIFLAIFTLAMVSVLGYMAGPRLTRQHVPMKFPEVPTRLSELREYLKTRDDSVKGLKPGNEAYIQWANPKDPRKTPFSIVYIHGFGASPMEGDPVHRFLATHFGANLYVTRLPEHGIRRDNSLEYLSPETLANAAGEAYQIGKSLGDEVIVVGTSMGGSLSLLLASQKPDIKALVLYSPAIRDYGQRLEGFFQPWQEWLMEKTMMENQMLYQERTGEKAAYWTEAYHLNAYESLSILLYSMMEKKTFEKIRQPLFLGYFYENDSVQDKVVSVPKMLEMFEQVSTPATLKREIAFPKSGDHVIASSITSEDWEGVLFETIEFLEQVVGIPPDPKFQNQIEDMILGQELLKSGKSPN